MLLENNGVRIRLTVPMDIETHLRNGWVKIEDVAPEPAEDIEEPAAPVIEVESEELAPEIVKAMDGLNLADPQLLAEISDDEILAVDGIGPASLEKIRAEYPAAPAEDEEVSE